MDDFKDNIKKKKPYNCFTYKALIEMGRGGFEPPTHGFSVRCSTN
jgi:hypothetical protein